MTCCSFSSCFIWGVEVLLMLSAFVMRGIRGVKRSCRHRIFATAQLGAPSNETFFSILLLISVLVWQRMYFIIFTCLFTAVSVVVVIIIIISSTLTFKWVNNFIKLCNYPICRRQLLLLLILLLGWLLVGLIIVLLLICCKVKLALAFNLLKVHYCKLVPFL